MSQSFVGYANSERAKQNGSDEREHRAHRQHVKPQGKVHGISPCFKLFNFSKARDRPEATKVLRCSRCACKARRRP
jgi:hypothetical protein